MRTLRPLALPSALFVAVWLCYLPGNMGCSDSIWSIPTAVSLLDHGDANLDEYLPVLKARNFVVTQRLGDHYYTIYPLGTSILAIPGVIALRPAASVVSRFLPRLWSTLEKLEIDRGCPPVAGEPIITLQSVTEHLIASAWVAATAVVIYLIAADELTVFSAVGLALLFGFGTSAWSSASRALWQHGPSMFLLSLALLMQHRGKRVVWVGVLLACAYVVRPTNVIPLAAAAGWVLLSRPRQLPHFVVGVAAVMAVFFITNRNIYGWWIPPYYTPGFYSRNSFMGEALAGHLISPNRGLFVYSPVLLFAPVGLAMKASVRRLTTLDLSLAACVTAHWIVLATTNGNWWGGASYGPRLFTDLVPYLTYFLLPVIAWIEATRGWRRSSVAVLFAVTALSSVGMHAQGALNPSTDLWNAYPINVDFEPARVWDWREPQFLAGLTFVPVPIPPVNLDAVACAEPPGPPGGPVIVSNRGGTVVLAWTVAAGNVAVYIAEVGSAPGTSNLPTREVRNVLHPSLTARRVPAGTYYVRVHGMNRCGDGPASPELAVTVP